MKKINTYYCLTESGKSPVREFINTQDDKTQRKFFFVRSLLEEFGYNLSQPHTKYIGDDIFELRFRTQEGSVRVLYFFFDKNKAIFTNGFIKKSGKIPSNERNLAIQRRATFLKSQQGGAK